MTSEAHSDPARVLNINVGVLGHVDSGKTSLCRALSTELSTAALDKNPQSRERGITLDLGFSAFIASLPEHMAAECAELGIERVQYTLVDCPGHASLIKTIIGGAQIIDLMVLVIDATKGIQTQTAECLVIGEVVTDHMIVVLNKTDKFEPAKREAKIGKVRAKLRGVFAATKFGADVPMVATSATGDGGVGELVDALQSHLFVPKRSEEGDFYFAVDHCFRIGGQGTVLTGTVLRGSVRVGQMVEVAGLGLERKVKSMQMFHKPVARAAQGDRLGICLTQLEPKLVERGILCHPGTMGSFKCAIARLDKIRFFKSQVKNKDHVHVTVGHTTVMATIHLFGFAPEDYHRAIPVLEGSSSASASASASSSSSPSAGGFDFSLDYPFQEELYVPGADSDETDANVRDDDEDNDNDDDAGRRGGKRSGLPPRPSGAQFAVLVFDHVLDCPNNSLFIGSRLDTDINANACRIAFIGRLIEPFGFDTPAVRERLHVFKAKQRTGTVDRVVDDYSVIGKGLFGKDGDINLFLNRTVVLEATGRVGRIESGFGQGGKFRAYFPDGLGMDSICSDENDEDASEPADAEDSGKKGKKRNRKKNKKTLKSRLLLNYKTYMFAQDKKQMVQ